jgi:ubiquinone/menaquinone biosynthesis C-methylase UbiE
MKITEDQKQVWDNIAEEWFEFKTKTENQNPHTIKLIQKQKGKILDVGCGAGRNFTKTTAEIYALDFSPEMIKYARKKASELNLKKIKFFIAESNKLPFEKDSFDLVLCLSVLHCITTKKERKQTLKEIYRVLKKNGKLSISVWNKNSTRFKNKKKRDFVSWRDKGKRYYYFYSPGELKKEIEESGFKINFFLADEKSPNISCIAVAEK